MGNALDWCGLHIIAGPKEGFREQDEIGGTALRLLHQLAASLSAAEAISRAAPSAAKPLMAAMERWGLAGSVLALEAIKRAIVLDNSSRDMLVGALLSAGLLQKLLDKLDWQRGGRDEEVSSFPAVCLYFYKCGANTRQNLSVKTRYILLKSPSTFVYGHGLHQ